ncbi:WD repeat-containing protein 46 [Anthonomus grandis grandis]|uniref:WD repeat-containing protein 46 n=1 Tax=Anthonomus grandis grandis TaxID=2921223 RepID=UPI00216613F6|nr:WD repeat-containing protein 46 [Anthonomus grandis grandis]
MVKANQRYFTKNEPAEPGKSKSTKPSNSQEIIEFDVSEVKTKAWGRRREDRSTKKFQNNKTNLNKNSKIVKKPKGGTSIFEKDTVKKLRPNEGKRKRFKVPTEWLEKHSKGEGVNLKKIHTKVHQKKAEEKERDIKYATDVAATAEVLLTEESGFLEPEPGETSTQFTQKQIADSVDVSAAAKAFELQLEFGPYRSKYTRNGRHLVLGGKKGHVASFDWVTKKLHCEINVMESVHDVSYLHVETMFAIAQKDWVYIYDNQGIELHCVKRLNKVTRLEFLPYHFLLASCSDEGYLSWLDVSIGQLVSQFNTNLGPLSVLTQNPWNACLCLGHAKGVVSMWSPNSRDPLAKMLCHKAPVLGVHVDPTGMYMATSASNRELKIWDVRKLEGPVQEYKLVTAATNLAFSQKKMLAVGMGNVVEVYRDCCTESAKRPYLRHRFNNPIGNFNFCSYEDVLGVSTARGFTSLLVPGSGEPNFDTYEANPFQSKKQRQEAEVKSLLEKIQPDLISLDPTVIAEVDVVTLRDKIEAKKKLLHLKPPKINYEPRNKAKGKGGSVKIAKNKKIVQEEARKEFKKAMNNVLPEAKQKSKKTYNVLDRFISKKK